MHEIIDQIREHLRGAWRFRWIALVVSVAVCIAGWAIVFMLPDRYGASARVYVDTRTALSAVTSGIALDTGGDNQIERVRQQMLGAPTLQRVGDEADLFGSSMSAREKQEIIDGLRKEIKIKGTGGSGVYVIEYQNSNREMSLRVVDRLLNTFLEGAWGGTRKDTKVATEFLEQQIADRGKALSDLESEQAKFKKENFAVMPGSQGDYYSKLQDTMTLEQKLSTDLRAAIQEREALQKQLANQQRFVPENSVDTGSGTTSVSELRIREQEKRLDELRIDYTDKHPAVIGVQETIAELKRRQAEEVAAAQSGDTVAAARVGLAPNPVYQQTQLDLNQNEVRIASLQSSLKSTSAEVQRLRGLMEQTANVEARYSEQTRDYDVHKDAYLALVQRIESTRIGEEAQQQGKPNFEIIDPPTAGFEPVAPLRGVLVPLVLVVALGAGGGVAYLMHMLKPVFYTSSALRAATGLPVLGAVPLTWLDRRRQEFRREALQYWGIVTALALFTLLVTWQHLRITDLTKSLRP